jgi:hypothetical protein
MCCGLLPALPTYQYVSLLKEGLNNEKIKNDFRQKKACGCYAGATERRLRRGNVLLLIRIFNH